MKSRTITIIIFLLVLASAISASPLDDGVGPDPDIFDELGGYATGQWQYGLPPLEPFASFLHASVAANNLALGRSTADIPATPVADLSLCSVQLPPTPLHSTELVQNSHSAFDVGSILPQTYAVPQPTRLVGFEGYTTPIHAGRVAWNASPGAPSDFAEPYWVDEMQQITRSVSAPQQLWPEYHPLQTLQSIAIESPEQHAGQLQAHGASTASASIPSSGRNTSARYRCDHIGCNHVSRTSADRRHHRRYHTPASQRPHGCPLCTSRFLTPREVQRHLVTHGVGDRYYCAILSCPYATKGFGRKDHLTRHVRSRHGA